MTSSLSRQLAGIAATSTNQLDLRAQRHAHSQSLLFDPKVAATQDFDTIYDHCIVGFQDLCRLDPRFLPFSSTIFSTSSKGRERGQLTSTENEELNSILERFLTLSCRHLLLQPTQKALEWLVRRFRVHEFNIETIVLSFLIYHPLPIFSTLLSILPKQLPRSLKFLHPYRERLQPPSGDVIQHAITTNAAFLDAWTSFVLESCKWGYQHEPMLSYWTIRLASAVEAQLEPIKAGGAQAQRQREEDVVRKTTALLEKALAFRRIPSIIVGCFIIVERLVLAANLSDKVISTFMDAIVGAASQEVREEALVGLIVLSQKLKIKRLSTSTFRFVMDTSDIVSKLIQRSCALQVESLTICLTMELIHQVSRKKDLHQSQILSQLLDSDLLNLASLELALLTIAKMTQETLDLTTKPDTNVEDLKELLLRLSNAKSSSKILHAVERTLASSNLDPALKTTVQAMIKLHPVVDERLEVEDTPVAKYHGSPIPWIEQMPKDTVPQSSYLTSKHDKTFDQLAIAFTTLLESGETLEPFLSSEFLRRDIGLTSPLFVSFFVRYWSLPFPSKFRATAISCISRTLQEAKRPLASQTILPYVLVGLADSSKAIRLTTVDLVLSLQSNLNNADGEAQSVWIAEEFYGPSEEIHQLSLPQFRKILQDVLTPGLEEFKMDSLAIAVTIRGVLSGTSSARADTEPGKLKKSSRAALLAFLAGHARATPILRVKSSLIKLTSGVHKAGGLMTFESFKPLIEAWFSMTEDQLHDACTKEKLDVKSLCLDIVRLVAPSSTMGNKTLQRLSTAVASKSILEAVLEYVTTSWASMNATIQACWALMLFERSVLNDDRQLLSILGLETLCSLKLSAEILEDFVKRNTLSIPESETGSPVSKRRKTTNGAVASSDDALDKELKSCLKRTVILLELIRNAGSTTCYTLLPGLFGIFQHVQRSKYSLENDLSYVHWLLLTCLREVVGNAKKSELDKLDHSDIRVDLVVDTLTHTADPQTQYAALLLLSSLAKLEPELVIHSMMPVFTFMGSSILRQDDDHAKFVVDQTINSVIPPLIESFRQHKGGALPGASGLILSFVAAFEHILPSRRIDLFSALIDRLGPDEYLFVLFVVLRDRYGGEDAVHDFISAMLLKYSPVVQFKTIQKCITVLDDSIQARPKLLKQIFASDDGSPRGKRSVLLADLPSELLRVPQLVSKILKVLRTNDSDAQIIRSCYADMVQDTLKMTLKDHDTRELSDLIAKLLGSLVGFFPVSESLRVLDVILQQPNEELSREVLRSLSTTIDKAQPGDRESRDACFKLSPSLVSVAERSKNVEVKRNAILCINGIVKKYGKTDTNRALEIALFIIGPACLQSSDVSVQIAALKAITTVAGALGEEIVPICPAIISKALDHLSVAISGESWHAEMRDTVYSLFTVLLSNIPWMITGDQLDHFLELSYISASTSTDTSCDEKRIKALHTFAQRSSPQTCFGGLARNWSRAVEIAGVATTEHLQILDLAIEKHPKAIIVNNITLLTDHFIEIMGLRASRLDPESEDWNEAEVNEVEKKASSILIKTIYKLNDTHFRPQFIRMSEWAVEPKANDETKRIRKLTSWFTFLEEFFDTLQSIVTNYMSYVVDTAIEVLTSATPDKVEARLLWEKTIRTLRAAFEHDQDDFWKSPSRFSDICGPLIDQIGHSSTLDDTSSLVSCITAFTIAVESAEHRAEIHAKILQHFKAEDARVRRAMFTCEISLTEALGDEWISLFESSSTYPVMSEALEDDNEDVENEVRKWKLQIEEISGESLDSRLQ